MATRLIIYKRTADITNLKDSDIRWVAEQWQFRDTFMDSQYVTFDATSPMPIDWQVGDFCVYRGVSLKLNTKPSVTQQSRRGEYGEAFSYQSVRMDSPLADLARVTILDITPSTHLYEWPLGENFTGSANFQLQCCETKVTMPDGTKRVFTPVEYLSTLIQANLLRVFGQDSGWQIKVEPSNTHTDDTLLSFNNTNALDALKWVKDTFSLYYCVIGKVIYVGYNFSNLTSKDFNALTHPTWDETGEFAFGYGKGVPQKGSDGKGIYKLDKKANSSKQIITRLRAYGSKRNLPYRYYQSKHALLKGMFVTNLQLPNAFDTPDIKKAASIARGDEYNYVLGDSVTDCYLDKNNDAGNCEEGIWEGVGVWDGSDNDHEEIYPTIEDVDYKQLRDGGVPDYYKKTGSSAFANYLDTEKVNVIEGVDERANIGDGIIQDFEVVGDQTGTEVSLSGRTEEIEIKGCDYDISMCIGQITDVQIPADYLFIPEGGTAVRIWTKEVDGVTIADMGGRFEWVIVLTALDKDNNVISNHKICTGNIDWVAQEQGEYCGYFTVDLCSLPYVADGISRKMTLEQSSGVAFHLSLWSELLDADRSICAEIYNRSGGKCRAVWRNANLESTFASSPFSIYIKDFGLDFANIIDTGSDPTISMKSGSCVACDFKISSVGVPQIRNNRTVWKLTLERCWDSSVGAYYPSREYPIKADDQFVILNCELPEGYIKAAEIRLLAAATKYLKKVQEQKYTYSPELNEIALQRDYDVNGTNGIYWNLYAGLKFPLYSIPETQQGDLPNENILIKSVSIKEGTGLPEIEVDLDDELEETIQQRLNNTISRLTSDSTAQTASDIKALKELIGRSSQMTLKFISKGNIIAAYNGTQEVDVNLNFLRNDQDDETSYKLTVGGVVSKGNAVVGGSTQSDNFVTGAPHSGSGWRITRDGDIEADSIKVRTFAEFPEIRFNRANIAVGTNIKSPCAGIIEEVYPDVDKEGNELPTGIAVLHLADDDIVGSICNGDYCWGYYHDIVNKNNNATSDLDDHNGIIAYQGFATVYFYVQEVLDSNSTRFRYELKEGTTLHPYVGMHFGGRGNGALKADGSPLYPERQGFTVSTPYYTAIYQLVSSWDWSANNHIVYLYGLLDGFEALANISAGTWKNKYGTICGDVYFRGSQHYVADTKRSLYITQSSNGMISEGETETVRIEIRDNHYQNRTSEFTITLGEQKFTNQDEVTLTYSYSDLTDELTRFTIEATDGETTLTGAFSIRKLQAQPLQMQIDYGGDSMIALGEVKRVTFRVATATGYDMTDTVYKWEIKRESTDAASDTAWNAGAKARAFARQQFKKGVSVDLTWSSDATENDIDNNAASTTFRITAWTGEDEVEATIEI